MNSFLKEKILTGVIWSLIQNWGARLGTLAVFMILAHILSPSEFGLFAAATTVLAFSSIFVESGLSEAVVQRERVSPRQINSIFTINIGLAIFITVTIWVSAHIISSYMKLPEMVWILRIGCLSILVGACSFAQNAMYRRSFNYKSLALTSLVATTISGIIAILMASANLGVWSLLAQAILSTTITTLMLWMRPEWKFSTQFDYSGIRPMLLYGGQRLTANLLDFANTRFIEIYFVTNFGASALGIYVVGTRLYQALMQIMCSAILDIAHNAFSRLSSDRTILKEAYYSAISVSAMIATPIFFISASVSTELIAVIFGSKWNESAFIAKLILLLGALQCLQYYNGIIFNSIGRPAIGIYLVGIKAAISFLAVYTQRAASFEQLILIYIISQTLLTPISFFMTKKIIGISFMEITRRIWPFIISSIISFFAITETRQLILFNDIPKSIILPILLCIGITTYLLSTLITGRKKIQSTWEKFKKRNDREIQ